MDNLSVNLSDFQHGSGMADEGLNAANLSSEQLTNLVKAMEAGHLQGGDLTGSQTNMGALKTESLERSLKNITFKESDIRFWKRFPKTAAYNTVEEYNQLTSYGVDRGGFNNEGELPEEEDSNYVRKAELVKYMGVTRSVTHPAQLVNTQVGNIIQRETTNGIMFILRKADRALLYGDSTVVSQEWNGLYAQHMANDQYADLEAYMSSEHVIDLRGVKLTEAHLETGGQTLLRKFAQGNLLVAPPVVLSDFATNFYDQKRFNVNGSGAQSTKDATVGQHISNFQGMYGLIEFEYDIFAAKLAGGLPANLGGTSSKAPAAPTPTSGTAGGSGSQFPGSETYFHAVSAINRYGESALVQIGTSTAPTVGQYVDLIFTATAGPYSPTGYIIYRSEDSALAYAATKLYPIMHIPVSGTASKMGSLAAGVDGAAALAVRDNNRWLPNTEEALLLQGDTDVIEFKQLAPLMKMPLAKLSPADRWMILLYGTPIVYAPSKVIRYVNIGRN
jgi:hypothetical protein